MKRIIRLKTPVYLTSYAAVGGKKEGEGPLGACFDYIDESDRFGKSTWEQSEAESQALALNFALNRAEMDIRELAAVFAGEKGRQDE